MVPNHSNQNTDPVPCVAICCCHFFWRGDGPMCPAFDLGTKPTKIVAVCHWHPRLQMKMKIMVYQTCRHFLKSEIDFGLQRVFFALTILMKQGCNGKFSLQFQLNPSLFPKKTL